MRFSALFRAALFATVIFGLIARAADPRPVVGPGATKDDVINAYGWPSGQSKSGTKEILNYPQGQVILEQGRVERVDFSMNIPWPAPRPRPAAPTASTAKKKVTEVPVNFWVTSFDQAAQEARRRNARILALFSGSDWSPASKQFLDEVALHPDFVNAFTGDFVFLRLDFVTRVQVAPELREQNNRLRERYGVTVYPSLLVLSPAGTEVARVDLSQLPPGDSYRTRVIAAIATVRDRLIALPPPPDPMPAAGAAEARMPGQAVAVTAPENPASASLWSASSLVIGAVVAGVVLAAGVLWLVWGRSRPIEASGVEASTRISDAAGGLPTVSQIKVWSRDKVCAVVAALAESDGYAAEVRPPGSDHDVALRRGGEPHPRVFVCCSAGSAGLVSTKRVRELFGTLTAAGVSVGWYVSPAGFAPDARSYAAEHKITLLDGDQLLAQLRQLPPLELPKVLARM